MNPRCSLLWTPRWLESSALNVERTMPDAYGHPCVASTLPELLEDAKTPQVLSASRVCLHCLGLNCDDYMLVPEVWTLARLTLADRAAQTYGAHAVRLLRGNSRGHLHLACVEALLGRPLTLVDFSNTRINEAIRWAWTRGQQTITTAPDGALPYAQALYAAWLEERAWGPRNELLSVWQRSRTRAHLAKMVPADVLQQVDAAVDGTGVAALIFPAGGVP